MQCKRPPVSTEHSVFQGSGRCGDGGSMAFPAPVWKHGVGDVAKESACGKCVCAARSESRWKRFGSSSPGGRLYRRWSGGRAFRRPSEQGERAGCGVGEGAPGRTKLACLSEERSRPERAAWIHQTGMPGPVSVEAGAWGCRPAAVRCRPRRGQGDFRRPGGRGASSDPVVPRRLGIGPAAERKKAVQVCLNGLAAEADGSATADQVASLFAISALVVASVAAARLPSAASTSCQAALLAFS